MILEFVLIPILDIDNRRAALTVGTLWSQCVLYEGLLLVCSSKYLAIVFDMDLNTKTWTQNEKAKQYVFWKLYKSMVKKFLHYYIG